jgi:predicted SAM-dependent methyltransferase
MTALRELYRILNPSGWGIIMAPVIPNLDKTYEDFSRTTPQERLKHFGQEDHVRVYAKNDFIKKLHNAGFTVRQLGYNDFDAAVFDKCGITTTSILYRVTK